MTSNNFLIDVRDLKFTYPGHSDPVLSIPDFRVLRGEELFLFGPSGSGKTTFLELLSGVLKADEGSLNILGCDLMKMSSNERDIFRGEHIGFVFQGFNLIPYLTVIENIQLPLLLNPARKARLNTADIGLVINGLCGNLGIVDVLQSKVTELSVGQQQRVAVARALIGKPDILFADEPTSALDADHREKFLRLMFELADLYDTTVVFVSHDRAVEKLFSRAISFNSINRVQK